MTSQQQARLTHLLALEFPTPMEEAEIDMLIQQGEDEYNAARWEAEMRQVRWAEAGGYAAGLARPA